MSSAVAVPATIWRREESSLKVGDIAVAHAAFPDGFKITQDLDKYGLLPDEPPAPPNKSGKASAGPEEDPAAGKIAVLGADFAEGELTLRIGALKPGPAIIPAMKVVDPAGVVVLRIESSSLEVTSAIAEQSTGAAQSGSSATAGGSPNPGQTGVSPGIPGGPGAQQAVDIRPPESLGFPWTDAIGFGVLGVGLLIALIWGLIRWSRSRKRGPTGWVAPIPAVPEDVELFRALDELLVQIDQKFAEKKHKEIYFGASQSLKRFISRRYKIDANESTSPEILEMLDKLERGKHQSLERLFTKLDLIKFTDLVPEVQETRVLLDETRKWAGATERLNVPATSVTASAAPSAGGLQ